MFSHFHFPKVASKCVERGWFSQPDGIMFSLFRQLLPQNRNNVLVAYRKTKVLLVHLRGEWTLFEKTSSGKMRSIQEYETFGPELKTHFRIIFLPISFFSIWTDIWWLTHKRNMFFNSPEIFSATLFVFPIYWRLHTHLLQMSGNVFPTRPHFET